MKLGDAELSASDFDPSLDFADAADDVARLHQKMMSGLGQQQPARMTAHEQLLTEDRLKAGNRA